MPRVTIAGLQNVIAGQKDEIEDLKEQIKDLNPVIPLKETMAAARNILEEGLKKFTEARPNWGEDNAYADEPYSTQQAIEELSQYV